MPLAKIVVPLSFFLLASVMPLGWAADVADKDQPASSSETKPGKLPLDDLRTFTKVYEHIRKGYVEEISDSTLLEYAIKGMLSELDPHSAYLNASSFDDLQVNTTGEFGGLGIEVGMENGFVKVISPIDDTPAAKAGVMAGDLIIKLDTKPVKGMNLGDAVEMMRGSKGSKITLTIVREGIEQPFELVIIRDIIKVQSVRAKILEKGYGYLRIAQFQVGTGADTIKAVEELKQDGELKGLIIDLRNNPGGVLQASVEVADAFLEDGLIVYTEGRIDNSDIRYNASPGDLTNGLPIVVLINDGSASASEIVAGALQDHRRAVILGTQSFGKGSVQTVIPLTDDRAIKLTTALYFTPKGRSIQAQGIKPDIEVERAEVTAIKSLNRTKEADLQGRLENGNGGKALDSAELEKAEADKAQLFQRDNQMFEALNLLKGINLFGGHRSSRASLDNVAGLQEVSP
ncbi:S41 family peptidase [Pseudomaricurvus alcaniphilus]|uniref:S41 family peptidase n=1 Tax=Pseudomaricurvus alcaniphilus TaxID=1166482 RepID=UPI001FB6949F|nr:S41 family peptidase [Pseudomaricurvus alcaniphilus]